MLLQIAQMRTGRNASARSSTLGSGGTAGAPDARVSRHEPHSSHARPRGAASPRRRTRGTRSELLTPPVGDRRTDRPPGEKHRPIRRARPVPADTPSCQVLVAASRPFALASALPPAWQSASGQPVGAACQPVGVGDHARSLRRRRVARPLAPRPDRSCARARATIRSTSTKYRR